MKKVFLLACAALLALSACQNVEPQAPANEGFVISLNADIAPATRTVYVAEGRKVNWVEGDKIGAKYPGGKDNVTLTLKTGAGTTSATFEGKASTSNATPSDPSDFVFYYPIKTGVGNGGTVTDGDNFVLENVFTKLQLSANILFESNWMFGVAKGLAATLQTKDNEEVKADVVMRNVMAVLDFTIKGEGALKRIYLTDLNPEAQAMWNTAVLTVKDGDIESLAFTTSGENEYDRTIITEHNTPIELNSEGVHVYMTVPPRSYSKGVRVGFELSNGDYMVKKLAENEGFAIDYGKVYTVPEVTFASTAKPGIGYYDGVEYEYSTFEDPRDHNVYRIATLGDNRVWMIDNLRYVPEGITPSADLSAVNNGVWYPVVLDETGTAMTFGSDADVARFGYCYNFCTALGKDADYVYQLQKQVFVDKTKTEAEAYAELKPLEGTQGICPNGWHVPTKAEFLATGSYQLGIPGSKGFVFKDFGCVRIDNVTATADPAKGTPYGFVNTKVNTTYMLLSTPNNNNVKMVSAIMTNVTNNTVSVANMNIRWGAPLRCVQDRVE